MSRHWFMKLALPATAVAALLMGSANVWAKGGGGGGGHGGGGHSSGGHSSGGHSSGGGHAAPSGHSASFNGGNAGRAGTNGNWNRNGNWNGHNGNNWGRHNGFGYFFFPGFGWGWGYGGYGYGGYGYGDYGYASGYDGYYADPGYGYDPSMMAAPYGPQGSPGGAPGGPAPDAQGQGPLILTDADVLINVRVPTNATVWINGDKTTQTGPRREFMSGGLTPGKTYTYTIRAQWEQGGKVVDLTQKVPVQGGERRSVNFTVPAPPPPPKPGPDGAN